MNHVPGDLVKFYNFTIFIDYDKVYYSNGSFDHLIRISKQDTIITTIFRDIYE